MKRRYITDPSPQGQTFAIGIASNEPIWKICWEINQLFSTRMVRVFSGDYPASEDIVEERPQKKMEVEQPANIESVCYHDLESRKDQDFFLFRGEFEWKDSSLKVLRYIFVIKDNGRKETISIEEILETLNRSKVIVIAIDISHIQDINKLLP